MSDHLIAEVLKIEEEADRIVNEARQKARDIIANVHHEIESIRISCENEYRKKLEIVKAGIGELQKSEEEGLRNESELLKKKLLNINSKSMEDAVTWVVKHIYES
jgi:vacuolar-type H+-ATPase subunit H